MAARVARTVKRLERPRPLKTPDIAKKLSTVEDVIQELEALHVSINNGNFDEATLATIVRVSSQLKVKGSQLEATYKDQLDRYFVTLRNASRDERIDMLGRLRLLEIIELRAMAWKSNENLVNYYKQRLMEVEAPEPTNITLANINPLAVPLQAPINYLSGHAQTTVPINVPTVTLAPGEILKTSGKFLKPTKIPGKNYYKDEIIIRNSDSGKVMGIKGRRVHMIEELSDTIISFQRVNPGAKDRLVQITGPSDESINQSKVLIEDTIRRNASPVREKFDLARSEIGSNCSLSSGPDEGVIFPQSPGIKKPLIHSYSMSDASIGEYCYTVSVGHDTIKISGFKADLVQTAKLVLEEYFAGQAEILEKHRNRMLSRSASFGNGSDISRSQSSDFESFHQEGSQWPVHTGPTSPLNLGMSRNHSIDTTSSWLCNGSKVPNDNREFSPFSSGSSSSEDVTFKENDGHHSDDEKHVADLPLDSPSVGSQLDMEKSFVHSAQNSTSEKSTPKDFPSSTNRTSPPEQTLTATADSSVSTRMQLSETPQVSTELEESKSSSAAGSSQKPVVPRLYSREFILRCAMSPLSMQTPACADFIARDVPSIVKSYPSTFNSTRYSFTNPQYKAYDRRPFDRKPEEPWEPDNP